MSITPQLDTDVRNRMLFRLLFGTQDDHYNGEFAAYLLAGLRNLDDESAAMTIKLWVLNLEGQLIIN